jgi:hypothetical protein
MESLVKPPLREIVIGKDWVRDDVPEQDRAFLEELGGPTLLRLGGRDPSRVRIVSTLLHGNEPSGLRAMIRFLRSGDVPATDVLLFIGAVGTALSGTGFAYRALPGARDANRCWVPPFDTPEGEIAREVLELFRSARPECLIDLHNNTGHNPAYGVAFRVGHAELSLVSLFADRIVHTPIELGTIVEATVPEYPSVTIECGRAGDPAADEAAWRGLRRYLDWDQIDFSRPLIPILVLDSPVRVCVRAGVDLSFGDRAEASVPLTISRDIDRHNFERLAPGSPIGWVQPGVAWPIQAFGSDGAECSRAFFEQDGNILRTRREFIPIMMTTNRVIAKSDCLFYAVQRAPASRYAIEPGESGA